MMSTDEIIETFKWLKSYRQNEVPDDFLKKWISEVDPKDGDCKRCAEHTKLRKYMIHDSCEDDTAIRDLARPFIGGIADDDGYAVTTLTQVVEELTKLIPKEAKK